MISRALWREGDVLADLYTYVRLTVVLYRNVTDSSFKSLERRLWSSWLAVLISFSPQLRSEVSLTYTTRHLMWTQVQTNTDSLSDLQVMRNTSNFRRKRAKAAVSNLLCLEYSHASICREQFVFAAWDEGILFQFYIVNPVFLHMGIFQKRRKSEEMWWEREISAAQIYSPL